MNRLTAVSFISSSNKNNKTRHNIQAADMSGYIPRARVHIMIAAAVTQKRVLKGRKEATRSNSIEDSGKEKLRIIIG